MKWSTLLFSLLTCLAITGSTFAQKDDSQSAKEDAPARLAHATADTFTTPSVEGVSYEVVDTPQGKALQVTSEQPDKPIIISVGWMDIDPDKAIVCQYQVQAVSMDKPASIYLLGREHAKKNTRPFTPYHKISSHLRQIPVASKGKWVTRKLSFTTTENTRALSGSLVVTNLKGTILISGLEVLDAEVQKKKLNRQPGAIQKK